MNPLEEIIRTHWLEILGWIANLTVVIQFLQKDMFKLRVWGIVVATLWFVYAVGIWSLPLMSLNILIFGIQAYQLKKLKNNLFNSK